MDAALERGLLLFIKQDDYLKVVRANPERSRFPVREEGQVELSLARRLTDLARVRACQQFQRFVNKER